MNILIPVSLGELYDKITILQIKKERITDKSKLKFIDDEYESLKQFQYSIPIKVELFEQLKKVNAALWEIEDKIRDKERSKEFDEEFIELARSVYITNDERSKIKRNINQQYGSNLVEVKSYKEY